MENDKIHKIASRLSIVSIIWGVFLILVGVQMIMLFLIIKNGGFSPFHLNNLLSILYLIPGLIMIIIGIRIKKNKASLFKMKRSLIFIILISLYGLLGFVISFISTIKHSTFNNPKEPLIMIVVFTFSIFLLFDSVKLLANSKKPQV